MSSVEETVYVIVAVIGQLGNSVIATELMIKYAFAAPKSTVYELPLAGVA